MTRQPYELVMLVCLGWRISRLICQPGLARGVTDTWRKQLVDSYTNQSGENDVAVVQVQPCTYGRSRTEAMGSRSETEGLEYESTQEKVRVTKPKVIKI